ncbi:MAG: carboxypeptidase regulatory-like domain-containing protein [Bacteroidota bacterium]
MRCIPILCCVLALSVGAAAQDDAFIVGVQTTDGEPIAGATVLVGDRGASTDADGEAVIEGMAPGRYRVRVSFIGKETRQLAARLDAPGPWGLIVELADTPLGLGEVVVEARDLSRSRLALDGFFERERLGIGSVLTREEIERKNPTRLGDALTGVQGVTVRTRSVSGLGASTGRVATSTRSGGPCELAVYLDGTYSPFLSEDIDGLAAQDVVAIEVYRGPAQIPAFYNQLGRGEGCGVILVWTSQSLNEGQ